MASKAPALAPSLMSPLGAAPPLHLKTFERIPPEARELELPGFLRWLGGPALFFLPGEDSSRCRLLSGGLHGNEPSGFFAIHQLLKDPPRPAVDTWLLLGNVPAAIRPPLFSHRFVPGEEDMNRVWDERRGNALREVSGQILDHLRTLPLEVCADLHNNTGYNPIYAVLVNSHPHRQSLARAWTDTLIYYEGLQLGSLLEMLDPIAPGVVIECGQAGDPQADADALAGARRFLAAEEGIHPEPCSDGLSQIFRSVARITIPQDVSIEFTHTRSEADLTISPDIDRVNFMNLPAGSVLAQYSGHGRLVATNNGNDDVTEDFLEHTHGVIRVRQDVIPVMMTTHAEVAKSDCLFYVAQPL